MEISYALRFDPKTSNNKSKYKALITGLKLGRIVGAKRLLVKSDSQLAVGQVKEEFQGKIISRPTLKRSKS